MTNLIALKAANERRWANVKNTRNYTTIASHLVAPAAKARYLAVEARTGVPWAFIAVAHEREASQNWNTQLGQGDPLNRVSVHVPAGRGPFKTWEEGAVDALVNCAPYAARNKDWSIGGTLTKLEEYNGLGYAARGRPSPYVWAGTNQYVSGKYVRDGVYDPNVVDVQPGCANLLATMMALDPTITFTGVTITPRAAPSSPTVPTTLPPAPPAAPASTGFWQSILAALQSIFKRK